MKRSEFFGSLAAIPLAFVPGKWLEESGPPEGWAQLPGGPITIEEYMQAVEELEEHMESRKRHPIPTEAAHEMYRDIVGRVEELEKMGHRPTHIGFTDRKECVRLCNFRFIPPPPKNTEPWRPPDDPTERRGQVAGLTIMYDGGVRDSYRLYSIKERVSLESLLEGETDG